MKTLKNKILKTRFKLLPIDPKENILIFSDPRGGSTWIMELIREALGYPVIWEPLNLRESVDFNRVGFSWRQYIPEDAQWDQAKIVFTDLFLGKIQNNWLNGKNKFSDLFKANHLIVKFCRGNNLLPYLIKNFEFEYKPIYMVRHPMAVVSSQMRYGAWSHFKKFEIPKGKYDYIYFKHKSYLEKLTSIEECLTAMWCLTNGSILNHKGNNLDWISLHYEDLVLNPEKCLSRIFNEWGRPLPIERLKYNSPSFTTREGSNVGSINQLGNWKKFLDKEAIDKMLKVLNYFEINDYDLSELPINDYN